MRLANQNRVGQLTSTPYEVLRAGTDIGLCVSKHIFWLSYLYFLIFKANQNQMYFLNTSYSSVRLIDVVFLYDT